MTVASDHIGGYAMLRHSPSSGFGCRSVGSLAVNLTTQFMDLEGPRYHYRPLFSIGTERTVVQLVQLAAEAVQDISESVQAADSKADDSWFAWFFGCTVDYKATKLVASAFLVIMPASSL